MTIRTPVATALVAAAALPGCGGDGATAPDAAARPPAVRQAVEKYTTTFDSRQTDRLFGAADDVDPQDLVGRWEMKINRTLGILEVLAPDGGGPMLEIEGWRGDALTLSERECRPFVLRMRRGTGGALSFSRVKGRCPETIDLLVEQPWRTG